jgi:GMP synthase (glutamine-hydrolysing)
LLASDKINKFQALHFYVGKSEIWGLQYHPEIPYDYMIKLIKHRSKGMLESNVFKNQDEIDRHINFIEKAKSTLSDDIRTMELKNWLDYLKN